MASTRVVHAQPATATTTSAIRSVIHRPRRLLPARALWAICNEARSSLRFGTVHQHTLIVEDGRKKSTRGIIITPTGFAPRTPRHALARAAASARSVRVGSLARSFA